MMKRKFFSFLLTALSLILMALPFGIPMIFAPTPTETVTLYYSYFSPVPFGYGNWFPTITVLLSLAAILVLLISFQGSLRRAAAVVLGAAMASSLASWLLFQSFSLVGLAVFALHGVVFWMQIAGNRQKNKSNEV